MRFPWSRDQAAPGTVARPVPSQAGDATLRCPGLGKILDKLSRIDRPEVLDLGPFCGDTAVYLAGHGLRVSVEELVPPREGVPSAPRASKDKGKDGKVKPEAAPRSPTLRIEQPDAKFHAVLVWEACDFVPTPRLPELGAELCRVLTDPAWVYLLSVGNTEDPRVPSRPPRYRMIDTEHVERMLVEGPSLKRYVHNPRDIERALAGLAVQGIQLQRNQLREFVLQKRAKNP